jgi:hypothetical protein
VATNSPTQSRDDAKPAKAPTEQDLNKLVKDLDLSSVEQEAHAKQFVEELIREHGLTSIEA